MFRANPEHTGVYDTGGIEPGNAELWRFLTGGWVYSSPTVANGVVYVGSEDKNLYAVGVNSSSLTSVPTTIRVMMQEVRCPWQQPQQPQQPAPVQRTTQHAPRQYAPAGAIVLILGISPVEPALTFPFFFVLEK